MKKRSVLKLTLVTLALTVTFAASLPFVLAAEPFRVGALNPITGSGSAYGSDVSGAFSRPAPAGGSAMPNGQVLPAAVSSEKPPEYAPVSRLYS